MKLLIAFCAVIVAFLGYLAYRFRHGRPSTIEAPHDITLDPSVPWYQEIDTGVGNGPDAAAAAAKAKQSPKGTVG